VLPAREREVHVFEARALDLEPLELAAVRERFRRDGEEVVLQTEEPTRVLHELAAEALADGRELEGLEVKRASLEDVYLALTGREQQ